MIRICLPLLAAVLMPACDTLSFDGRDVAEVCNVADSPVNAECPVPDSSLPYSMNKPNVKLLVDRSSSMELDGRWDALQSLRPYLPAVSARSNLGLQVFPAVDGDGCKVNGGDIVPIGAGEAVAADISDALADTVPDGKTPMAAAIESAAKDDALQCPNRDNIVVLLTDGEESCQGNVYRAVEKLVDQREPIEFFVIGFGTSASTNRELEAVANMASPTTSGDNFYTADNVEDLLARLAAVTGTCTAQLDIEPEGDLVVNLDGVELAECTEDRCDSGYTWDPSRLVVRIEGSDCLAFSDGACHDLSFDER